MRRHAYAASWALACLLGAAIAEPGWAQPPQLPQLPQARPQLLPHYAITVRLDPADQRAHLSEHIRFRNGSRAPLDALLFHLYPNAFAGEHTVFMREGGTTLRGQELERTGGLTLTRLAIAGGESLLGAARALGPKGDATQLSVPLPRPLGPGEMIELELEGELRLPSVVARMGQAGDFCMLAQFYPKLAKLETDGTFAGHPYHGLGEFYADFADHELTIEVPEDFVVVAPGARLGAQAAPPGMRRERYALDGALDIAFAAAPDLVRVSTRAHGVALEAFAPRGHARLARSQLALVSEALGELTAPLGPYPYERLAVLLPPRAARGAEGMEYPGLIVSQHVWALTEPLTLGVVHDVVTTHELAHQWFPIALGTDEVSYPWLDEGIAQWLGTHVLRERYGPRSSWARLTGLPLEPFFLQRASFRLATSPPSSLLPAPRYRPHQLAPSVYLRPALALESVARAWGRARLLRALGDFARTQRFAHPGPEQLFATLDRHYWPRFSLSVLRPLLDGARPTHRMPARSNLLDEAPDAADAPAAPADTVVDRASPNVLVRMLTLAQAALGLVGP